ncbi:MAG: hypothetical protein CMJ45_05950 [Planctomyces sp.]|nr:hypothetical protein [Planctomyces sp.]
MTKGGGVRLGRVFSVGIVATALLLLLLACGGGDAIVTTAPPDSGATTEQVEGLVVEVVGRNIVELETLRIRTSDEQVLTFTADGPLAFSPSHLREHQLFGQMVVVSYVRRGQSLVAVEITD